MWVFKILQVWVSVSQLILVHSQLILVHFQVSIWVLALVHSAAQVEVLEDFQAGAETECGNTVDSIAEKHYGRSPDFQIVSQCFYGELGIIDVFW